MFTRRADGFTLLEVLVALAIAGLALILLFRTGGEGLFAVDTAARAEEAVERAQSHLAAVGRGAALQPGDFHGDDGGGYRWRLRIKPLASQQAPADSGPSAAATALFDVEVTISWSSRGHRREVVLNTERIATEIGSQ